MSVYRFQQLNISIDIVIPPGYVKTQHDGGSKGFRSLVTLIEGMDMGVYVTLTRDDIYVKDLIHDFILDLLLEEQPWLDKETACLLKQKGT